MKHFARNEFTCRCGCGRNNVQGSLLTRLTMARDIAGIPFVITSGCRCGEHNRHVGGVDSSAHIDGYAADIAVSGSQERYKVVQSLLQAGVKRIGVGKGYVHADVDPAKSKPVIWYYE